jgi:hypothetical protein
VNSHNNEEGNWSRDHRPCGALFRRSATCPRQVHRCRSAHGGADTAFDRNLRPDVCSQAQSGYLFSPKAGPYAHFYYEEAQAAASKMSVQLDIKPVNEPTDFEPLLAQLGADGGAIFFSDLARCPCLVCYRDKSGHGPRLGRCPLGPIKMAAAHALSSSSTYGFTLRPRAIRAMLSIETFRSDRSTPLR